MLEKKGLAIIISSPSGAGKTTVTKEILKKVKNSCISISCTTRQPRSNEINKKDYFFVTKKKFFDLKKNNKFIETAKVYGNFYGTLHSEINKNLKKNRIVLLDVDWQGARALRKKIKNNFFSFFLLPPNKKTLKKRLFNRHKDSTQIAYDRFSSSKKDISHWTEYDFIFINDNLKKCVKEVENKITYLINEKKYFNKIEQLIKKLQ